MTSCGAPTSTSDNQRNSTGRDTDYLVRLRDYYQDARRIPSQQRICELMGFASKTAARKLLQCLETAGLVESTPDDDAWMPSKRFFERPLANTAVRAGAPDMIEAGAGEPFLVDDYLIRQPSYTVMVPVKGDSMIDAGIHDGDIAWSSAAVRRRKGTSSSPQWTTNSPSRNSTWNGTSSSSGRTIPPIR